MTLALITFEIIVTKIGAPLGFILVHSLRVESIATGD